MIERRGNEIVIARVPFTPSAESFWYIRHNHGMPADRAFLHVMPEGQRTSMASRIELEDQGPGLNLLGYRAADRVERTIRYTIIVVDKHQVIAMGLADAIVDLTMPVAMMPRVELNPCECRIVYARHRWSTVMNVEHYQHLVTRQQLIFNASPELSQAHTIMGWYNDC